MGQLSKDMVKDFFETLKKHKVVLYRKEGKGFVKSSECHVLFDSLGVRILSQGLDFNLIEFEKQFCDILSKEVKGG